MQEHARIGLVLLRSGWEGCGVPAEARGQVEQDGEAITGRLRQRFDVQGPWIVDGLDTAGDTIAALASTDFDLILLAFQTWVDEAAVLSLVNMPCACPIIVWSVLPWRRLPRPTSYSGLLRTTGAVSAFSALGELRNQDLPFLFTWGAVDDPRLLNDLDVAARAAQIRSALRHARFGLLPAGQPHPRASSVDERRLLTELGPFIEHIAVDDFSQAAQAIGAEQVQAYLASLRRTGAVVNVPDATLEEAARRALGLAELCKQRRLDLLAVDVYDGDLRRSQGLRLGLYPDLSAPEMRPPGAPLYQPEADLGAATANYVLSRLSGSQAMLLELWYWDEALNQMIGGHGGMQDPALGVPGGVWISRDYDDCTEEEERGAQVQLVARPGRVTLFQLRATPTGWQAIAASGVVLESRPVIEGLPHAVLRLDAQVAHFLNTLAEVGATQHWVMGYGSVLHELEAFCQMEHIALEILTS